MGATNNEEIVNLAVVPIGQTAITSLSATTNTTAVKANAIFANIRRELLRAVKPQFAIYSAKLGHVVDSSISIASITVSSGVITIITSTAHGLSTGDEISLVNVGGMVELNGGAYTVTVSDTITLT